MDDLGAVLLNQNIWNEQNAAHENFDNEMDEDEDRDAEGTFDGGVARGADDATERKSSSECELLFYLVCEEALDFCPQHPILRPGIIVTIGLSKSTKLSAVFQRYVDFCNEATTRKDEKISLCDLEFVHCQLLNGSDNAETSGLMKNDKIKVRKDRSAERAAEQERVRLQREADRNYFHQMRHLMPDMGGSKTADVILDCKGKLSDESGRNQQVLSSTVKAHSVILKKRCPWLEGMIRTAEIHAAMDEARGVFKRNDDLDDEKSILVFRVESDLKSADEIEDNDDDSAVLSFAPKEKHDTEEAGSGAAEIEIDDEDDDASEEDFRAQPLPEECRPCSPAVLTTNQCAQVTKFLRITLDHSPEAVKLLLEYCYTNRVASLGQDAFVHACRTRPLKHAGPVAPYPISTSGSRRWPKNGHPTVTFSVAVAGIMLADEAGLPRLSLMCEVAASQLLTSSNVVDALSLCATQRRTSGNDLPLLRKAAMSLIFRSGSRGVSEIARSQSFNRGLASHRSVIIPMLLQGTLEAITTHEKNGSIKRDKNDISQLSFEVLDSEDKYRRAHERKKRRLERIENDPSRRDELDELETEYIYDEFRGWAHEAPKQSLKRMAKHLDSMTSRSMAALAARSPRYPFPASAVSNIASTRRPTGNTRRRSSSNQP